MMLATFFFAVMNAAVKWLTHLPAIEIAFLRSVVSLAVAWIILKQSGIGSIPESRSLRKGLIMRGLYGSSSLVLYFITLQNMPLASAVTLQYLSPVFTAFLGIYMVHEPVKPAQWLFFAISFGGVVLVQGFDDRIQPMFMFVGLASAMAAALSYNTIRQLKHSVHPLLITFYFPLVSLPVTALLLGTVEWVTPAGTDWLVILLIGVCAQAAQYFMTRAYQSAELARVVSMKYLGTLYALFFGYMLFDETFSWIALAGMCVVLVGVLLNVWYKREPAAG